MLVNLRYRLQQDRIFIDSYFPRSIERALPPLRETMERIRTWHQNVTTNMTSREVFLSEIQNNLIHKLRINYYSTGNAGFSISSTEFKKVTEKVHESLVKMIDGGFQFVGISLSDYLWLPCLILSIWKSGNACACVGTQYADEYNANFMDGLNVKYVITDNSDRWSFAKTVGVFQINDQKFYIMERKFCPKLKKLNTNICYGIMTSGTTGIPKTVQVPWSCILPNVSELVSLFSVQENDNIGLLSPYTFDPFFVELFMWMMAGCCLTIISPDLKMCSQTLLNILFKKQTYNFVDNDVEGFGEMILCKMDKITESLVTVLQMTPSMFKRWSVTSIENCILSSDSSLRILVLGGEKFPGDILKLKSNENQTKIYNIYGITEMSCWAFISEALGKMHCEEISIGKPLNDVVYKIDENCELHIGSGKRKCLIDSETNFDSSDVVFRRTGDLVTLKDGQIYFKCRANDLVKKFGIKINLEKIRNSFLTVNKRIPDCVCVFDENAMKTAIFYVNNNMKHDYLIVTGKRQKMLMNFNGSTTSNIEIPDYIIEMQRMPVNRNGKRDKGCLLQILGDVISSERTRADTEETFKNVWTSFVDGDNFIVSGGDSVRALQILTRLEENGVDVPQNFLQTLLKDGGYENCLSCLISCPNSLEPRSKKAKMDDTGEKFKLSVSWTFDTMKCVDASPVVCGNNGDGNVIVGSHSSRLSSVRIDSGEENWTINLGDRIESGVCTDKSSTFGVVGCYDTYAYCISLANGKILWKYKTDGMIKSTPCLSTNEENVYVASYDTFLYCLQSRTGSMIKKVKLSDRGIFSSGVVSDELKSVFIATLDGTCISLSQETNTVKWKISLANPIFASPLLIKDGPDIAVIFAEVVGRLHCFDARTGTKIWHYQTDACIYCTPVYASKSIIFGCYKNKVNCLTFAREPVLQWRLEVDSPIFARPCFFETPEESFVVVATTKGWIYLCTLDSGLEIARTKLNGEIFSSPKMFGHNLVVGCRDNNLYCLKITDNIVNVD